MIPSFCRVTGNSRNLPKPNYFPLLPPISPAEARRICKLTGKSQSWEDHHYVPVIEFGKENRTLHCHITQNSEGNEVHNYDPTDDCWQRLPKSDARGEVGCRITSKYQVNSEYVYVFPVLEPPSSTSSKIAHQEWKELEKVLNKNITLTKNTTTPDFPDQRYVYALSDENISLVLPAALEDAVRQGDIESLLMSKAGDRSLLRLRNGKTVSLPLRQLSHEEVTAEEPFLYQGGGQESHVLKKQKKIKAYKKRKMSDSLVGCRRRFLDIRNNEETSNSSLKKVEEETDAEQRLAQVNWSARVAELDAGYRSAANQLVFGPDWRDLVYPNPEKWDWDAFPQLGEEASIPLPETLPSIEPLRVDINELSPGPFKGPPLVSNDTVGFEAVPVFEPIPAPLQPEVDPTLVQALQQMSSTLTQVDDIKTLFKNVESAMLLPFIHEVEDLAKNLSNGTPGALVEDLRRGDVQFLPQEAIKRDEPENINIVEGLLVTLGGEERFVMGRQVEQMNRAKSFVAGRTALNHANKHEFQPGIVVQTPEAPGFIPGLVFLSPGQGETFYPGEILTDAEGHSKFHPGQALQTLHGPKFTTGFAIPTPEGPKFIAGHVHQDKLLPGQLLKTQEGIEFISGQTYDSPKGVCFLPGRVVSKPTGRDFIPGQDVKNADGDVQFAPGYSLETPEGPVFVPGIAIPAPADPQKMKFVAGIVQEGSFIPGLLTEKTGQFVVGKMAQNPDGSGSGFVPGKIDPESKIFEASTKLDEVQVLEFKNCPSQHWNTWPVSGSSLTATPFSKPEMGYMKQDAQAIKFYRTETNPEIAEGECKIVSGQLWNVEWEETPRFIPGKLIETAIGTRFVSGQLVRTQRGEQFTPGVVIDSRDNPPKYPPKFVPGQLIETKDGKRFCPGQVLPPTGKKGGPPRFVVGNILQTTYGATFVPSQVMYTDQGSRLVPGNIHMTTQGPRFVPAVLEDVGNGVKFREGVVVETPEGPRYLAPDLEENEEGALEFTVQSFEVTPEELRLITAYPFAALHFPLTDDEPLIDARMLRQMAAAGAAVERYTAQHLHDVKISCPQDTNTAILGANAFNVQEPDLESLVTRPAKTSQKKAATTGMQSEGTYRPSQQDTNTMKEPGSGVHSTTNEDSSLSQTGLNSLTGSESVQKGLSDTQLSDSEAGGETDDCQAVSVDPVEELTSSGTEQTNELSEKTNKLLDLSVDVQGTSVSQNQLELLADKDETDLGNKTQSTTCSTENQDSVKGSNAHHTSKTNLTNNQTSVTNGDSQIEFQDSTVTEVIKGGNFEQTEQKLLDNDGSQASQFPQDIDSIDGNASFASAAGHNDLDRTRDTNEQETSRKSSMTCLHDQKALTKTDGEVGNATHNFGTNEASSANDTIPLTRAVSLSTISYKDSENAPSACGLPNDSQTMKTNEINAEDPRNATEFISGKEKNREGFNDINSKSLTSSVEGKGKNSLENSKEFISEEGTCQAKGLHGNSVLQQGHGQTAGDCEPCDNLDLANSTTLELSSTEPAHDKYDGPSSHNSQDVSDPGCSDGDVRGTTRKEGPCQDISRLGAEERKENLLIGDVDGRVPSPTTHQGISLANLETSPSTTKSSLLPEDQIPPSSNTSPQQSISVTPTLSECPVAGRQTSQISNISKSTDKTSQESNNLATGHGPLAEHSHGLTNTASSSEASRRLTTPPNSTGLSQSSNSCKNSEKTALTTSEQSKSNTLQAVNRDGQTTHNPAALAVSEHAKHLGDRHATSDDGFHKTAKENSVGIGSMPNTTGSSDSVPLQHREDKSAPVTQSDAPNSFTPAVLTAPSRSKSTANSSTVLLDSTLTSTKANNEKTGENNELVEQDKDLAKITALERNKNSSPPCTQSSAGNLTSECLDNQSLGDTAELFTSGDQLGTKIQLDRGMLENVDNSLSATGNGLTDPVNQGDLAGARHVDGTMLDRNHSDSITALLGASAIESKVNSRHGQVANEDVNINGARTDEGSQVSSNRGGDDFQHGMPGIDNGLAVATDAERSHTFQAASKFAGSLHKEYQDAEQVPMKGSSGTIEGQFRRSEPGTQNHSQGTKGGRHTLLDSAGADTPKSSQSLSVDANDGSELDISSTLPGPRELDDGSRSKTHKATESLVLPNSEASNKDVSTLGTKGVRQGNRKTSHDKGDLLEGGDSEGMKLSTAIDLANANLKSQSKCVSRNRQAEESNVKNRDSNVKYLNDSRDDETKVLSPSSLTATSLSASTSRKDSQEIREKKAHLHFLSKLLDKDASEDVNEESGYGDSVSPSKQTDTHSFVKNSQDRLPGTMGLNDSLMSSSTDHASLAVQAFFKRIKSDLDCVEEDPFIRGTLKQAEGLALVIGRPDLAQNVRQLLDILKNSQGDEEMVHLIANILSLKEMAENNPELEELLQKVENKPELIAQDKNLKENLAQAIAHIEKDTTVGETAGSKEPSQQFTSDRNLDSQERKTTTQVPGLGHLDDDKVYENVSPRNSTQKAENNAKIQSKAGSRNANASQKFANHNDATGVDQNHTELSSMPQGQGSRSGNLGQEKGKTVTTTFNTGKDLSSLSAEVSSQEVSDFGQATSQGKQSLLRSLGNAETGKYAENIGKLNDGISDTNQSQLAANGAPATKDTSTGQKELIPQELNNRNRNTDSNAQYCSANGENHSANANGEFLLGQTENLPSKKNDFDGAATKLRQSTADPEKTLVGGDIALESQIKAKDSDRPSVHVKSILSRKSSNPNQQTNADILAGDSSESTAEGHESKSFLNRTENRGSSSATPLDVPDEDSEISETPIMRRPPRTPKRISVTSRPSSLRYSSGDLLRDSQNPEEDEDKTSSRNSAAHSRKTSFKQKCSSSTDPNNTTTLSVGDTVFPNIITSSKDIPQEIIDTLRYSTDEAKKELYVEQILDALARTQAEHLQLSEENEVNDEEDEFDEQSSQKRRARFTPRRKSSACVILKDFLETIVPRDAARGVLIGDIDYMVIDEDGVRYFESASEFASRRSSRFDLRLSRAGSSDSTSGPWPWADTAPSSASRSRRCSVDEHMRRARLSRSDLKAHKSQPATRQSSAERLNARRGRFSMPISRSPSSSAITSLSAMSSRRSSVSLTDEQQRRKRKISDVKTSFEESGDGSSFFYHEEHQMVQKRPISQTWDEDLDMDMGDEALLLLDNSAAMHKLAVRPKKKHDTRKSPRPESLISVEEQEFLLTSGAIDAAEKREVISAPRKSRSFAADSKDPRIKREAVVRELIETEDEFIKDMQHVVERYYNHMESSSPMPRNLQDHRDDLFGPFKKIYEFHQSVLSEGLKYYADEPKMIGRTFLRLERDFDKHVKYCELEPQAQALLAEEDKLREYFEDYGVQIGDDKLLSEHLKLPIQRINDYQLLLQELVNYSSLLKENTTDLQKAHELMLSIPQRHSDAKFTANISGYQGNINKLGRLLRHEWFTVTDNRERTRDRYLFLFKARILVTKVRRITDDRSIFLLKDIIKLPDLEVRDCHSDPPSFQLIHPDPELTRYPLTLQAQSQEAHDQWLAEIRKYATDAVALAEHAADDLQVEGPSDADYGVVDNTQVVQEEPAVENIPDEGVEELCDYVEELEKEQTKTLRSASAASVTDYHSLSQADDYHSMADLNEDTLGGTRPRFTHTIRGAFCEPGEKASFECTVESDPPASVTWLKGNRPLDDKLADRVQVSSRDKIHRLSIMNCRLEDGGLYTVHAANDEGATTCSAQLVVQELTKEEREKMAEQNSPSFLVKLRDAELLEGTSVRFMIKVKGEPNPTVQIKKDGQKIKDEDRVKIVTDQAITGFYELVISSVQPEDAGLYSCVASNRYGEVLCEANVTVTNEKQVFALLQNQSLLEPGEQPVFTWFRDGSQIDPDERFKVLFQDDEDTLALVFQHVKPEDAGLYTCIASTTSGKISCSAELSVQGSVYQLMHPPEPPCILADLTDTEVSCGGSAMMELKVKGYPKPQIIWYKAGEEVRAGGRFRFLYEDDESIALIIKGVTMDDAGLYTVVAKNELGEVTTEGRLYVKAPPKFKKKMADMACMTDETFKMKVEVEGSPAPELKWYKDGQMIMESERIKIVQESEDIFSLVIERVSMDDSGSYSVVASNALGQMSEFWQVIANAPPKFLKALLKNMEGEEGETITFNVAVQGNPKPTVTWTKDGKPITPDGKKIIAKNEGDIHTLTLVGVKRGDAGRYGCLITNPYGGTEDTATLNVRAAPQVTQPLTDIQAKEGENNVAFTVVADAYPQPKIRWFVDEVEITEERKEFIRSQDGDAHTLVLKEVKTDMAGKYSVEISNSLGSTRSTGTLSVMSKPKITAKLTDAKVDEGQSASFTVKVEGVPEPSVKWFKDGNEVSASARIKVKKDQGAHTLTIDGCTGEDAGKYEAKVSNTMGDVSTSATLTVDTKPKVLSDNFEYREIYEEEEIRYEIRVIGSPKPEATWYKDQEVITKSEKINITESSETYTLTIKSAAMSDAGIYSVKLKNRVGEVSKEEKCVVKSLQELRVPKILNGLENTVTSKGKKAEFTVRVRGDPKPTVEWFKDGEVIKPSNDYIISSDDKEFTYTLVIPSTKESDAGKYTVRASNPHGADESSAELTIVLKPEITVQEEVVVKYGEDIFISARVNANPKPDVKWTKDGKDVTITERVTITIEETCTLRITQSELNDAGTYTLQATNSEGQASSNTKVKVTAEKPAFVKKPSNVSGKVGDRIKLTASISGIPTPAAKWLKDGKEISKSEHVVISSTEDGRCVLLIDEIVNEDYGKYTLKIYNPVGEDEASADVLLTMEPPTLAQSLPKLTKVTEEEPLKLQVKLGGSPLPETKWYKDNEEIVPDERCHVSLLPDGTATLEIASAVPADSGVYKLVAANAVGQVTTQTAVDVQPKPKKPKFGKKLEPVTVIQGQPLKLQAQITGYPKPAIKWLKDGRPLRATSHVILSSLPDGNVALEIDSTSPEDAGKYTLVVTNDMGETSSVADVNVEPPPSPPVFTSPLFPSKATEGYPVTMEAKLQGRPTPSVAWLKDGKPLKTDGERVKASTEPDSNGVIQLNINAANLGDTGDYEAVATNSEGEVKSSAKLDVKGRERPGEPEVEPSFLTPLKDVSVDEGSPLKLSAKVNGNPIPDVEWKHNGEPVGPSKAKLAFDGDKAVLEIPTATPKDAGEYELVAKNKLGTNSTKANVGVRKIYSAPKFTQPFTDLQQLPLYDAKFLAKVSGLPKPDIAWLFKGKPIVEDDKYKIKRDGDICVLFIRDCTEADAGKYTCVASNIEGEAKCEAELEIVDKIEKRQKAEPPSFLKKIGDCEVYEGMTAKFTACASGWPEPEFEWFRDDLRLFPSDRIKMEREGSGLLRLTIRHVDEADVGRYKLRVFNPHGEATCEADLSYDTLDSRPKRPLGDQYVHFDKYKRSGAPLPLADRPIINRLADRHLTLSWKPSLPLGPESRTPVTYQVEMSECPDGEWFPVRSGIRGCCCEIRNLDPFRDYKFRVRVENKYGVSDPSPHAMTYREKLDMEPSRRRTFLPPGLDFHPDSSSYFPKDFDLERPPHDGYSHAPKFLRQEHDAQYGIKNQTCSIHWYVYGYPKPSMTYYFNGELIEMGGRFSQSYTRNGQATLFVNRMLERDVGVYEAVANNEHGEARQRIQVEIAEHPKFIERPEESIFLQRKSGRLQCTIWAYPEPEVKWYKDWQPLAASNRVKIQHINPDVYILSITDVISKDEGLYSVVAKNPAGSISASATVHVEESEDEYAFRTYTRGRAIKPSDKPDKRFEDLYDIGDELGRGTQGVTYHVVERLSGRNYAAKRMRGDGELRSKMLNELEIMNQLNDRRLIRLMDAYEDKRSVTLVTELASGGELLDVLTKQPHITEGDIANYIRQVLQGLEHMHSRGYAHLGLTPGDLLFARPGGDELKIIDFSLSRRIFSGKLASLDYGMPEFVSPEIANGEGVGLPADMWSVGILTYLLLSGISPFRGENDRETLQKVQKGQMDFDMNAFSQVSDQAKDFIAKLLVFHAAGRMDVKQALSHPWLKAADVVPREAKLIPTDRLKHYNEKYRDWYANASCRTWFRRRPLSGAFTHPSRMVYPPGEEYTPRATPERRRSAVPPPEEPKEFEPIDYELGQISSESHYQYGPDTYLLQLRDVDFPVRLRRYMKTAASRSPTFALRMKDSNFDPKIPVIRERRRFTDVMDEEIDDERKARMGRYTGSDGTTTYQPRRLKHEIGLRPEAHAEAEAILDAKRDGQLPFMREKPETVAMIDNFPVQLSCLAVGDPKPVIQWFKNDVVLASGPRIKIIEEENGRSILRFEPATTFDMGVYKVVARNKWGQTMAKARILLGDLPGALDSPEIVEISDTEVLLRWRQPRYDGNSPILCYAIEVKAPDANEWQQVASNIDHEFFVVRNLQPLKEYHFRLAARNKFGWGDKSIASDSVTTKESGSPKVSVTRAMKYLQQLTESKKDVEIAEETREALNYTVETEPLAVSESDPRENYNFIGEIGRGRFSCVIKCAHKATDRLYAAKVLERGSEREEAAKAEVDLLRSLRHERLAATHEIFASPTSYIIVMEKLQSLDILTYLAERHEYTEEMVANVIAQVLDGLQYLHWRGLAHLNLQPDNVVLTSTRNTDVKLVDLGSAQRVSKMGTLVKSEIDLDFAAPELLNDEAAYQQTDIWSLGVLTYLLLSGVSPFRSETPEETRQNITYVRYRFEHLYKEITMEANRFLMLVFKRAPNKRPTAEECMDHRWLQPSEHLRKKRERAVFLGNRLKEYSDGYHGVRAKAASRSESLLSGFGLGLNRSASQQSDIYTTF